VAAAALYKNKMREEELVADNIERICRSFESLRTGVRKAITPIFLDLGENNRLRARGCGWDKGVPAAL